MNSEFIDLQGTRTTLAHCCERLGITPPLLPRQRISWTGWDEKLDIGMNAQIDCFEPALDDEPYVLSFSVYERIRVTGSMGEDFGTENRKVVTLDFAQVDPTLEPGQALVDPLHTPLLLAMAEVNPALEGCTLDEVLDEVRQILAGWPVQREQVGC
ncbi:MAG: hypothetical protein V2J55_02330 [Candidatus Competibacteraceae bacterium]|jgi:hypothetical protein|nr:hypothetical protein [Candidatus Competibacteraceae bacterium]